MPYRRRGSYMGRRSSGLTVVNSIKNMPNATSDLTGGANAVLLVAKAVTSPAPTVSTDVSHGCVIKAIWVSIDFCGLAGSGILNSIHAMLFKNPGANLTPPLVSSTGTSNEKKFVIKYWQYMGMRNQEGNPPYHWEGWIKIPKRYQRMGTDDTWSLIGTPSAGVTGHISMSCIYKWYR